MSTATFPSSSTGQWKDQHSDWQQTARTANSLKGIVSNLIRNGLTRIGELFLIGIMLIGNVLCGLTLLIGIPMMAVFALSSLVIVISSAIVVLGAAFEFLGLI